MSSCGCNNCSCASLKEENKFLRNDLIDLQVTLDSIIEVFETHEGCFEHANWCKKQGSEKCPACVVNKAFQIYDHVNDNI